MTQYLIEEACQVAFDVMSEAEVEREQEPPKPGQITDPVMQDALEKAKALHQERFGNVHQERGSR